MGRIGSEQHCISDSLEAVACNTYKTSLMNRLYGLHSRSGSTTAADNSVPRMIIPGS
jgi:hypothetical protein